MFRAAVFLIVKNWKELRCPSLGEWINYGSSILQSIGQELKKKKRAISLPKCVVDLETPK